MLAACLGTVSFGAPTPEPSCQGSLIGCLFIRRVLEWKVHDEVTHPIHAQAVRVTADSPRKRRPARLWLVRTVLHPETFRFFATPHPGRGCKPRQLDSNRDNVFPRRGIHAIGTTGS